MRKIKHYWIVFLCLFIFFFSPAQHVPESTARIVAENFINSRLNGVAQKGSTTNLINITSSINAKYTGLYVFKNASGTGFYIISSEYGNHPVLGYSDDTTISSSEQIAPGFLYFLDWYQSVNENLSGIPQSKGINDELSSQIKSEWETLLSTEGNKPSLGAKPTAAELLLEVNPLLTTKWNQRAPYNQNTPVTSSGNALTGCVATAMAQIMKYHNHPTTGTGSRTYTIPNDYYNWNGKNLTANFGGTTYDWANMPNSLYLSSTTAQKNAVATLMSHVGISVNMIYGPSASGAYSSNVDDALKNYFRYPNAAYVSRGNYTNDQWLMLIKDQITKGYPVYFSGDSNNGSGHAFVADGYDANNYIHFNFGWGGSGDGHYQITQPNPPGHNFSGNQAAVINIYPPPCNSYCASQSFSTSMERINKVVFGSINNTSTGTSGYENFTFISTNVIKKSSYTITITPQLSSLWILGNHQKGYAVFIDFNQDGDFSDAGETVWTQTPTTAKSVSGTIKIPANALSGTTRMRVSMKYNNINIIYNDIPRPCELSTYGQVEDYSVNIVTPLAPTTPTNLKATVTGTSAVLSWTPVNGATNYTLQYRPSTTSSWTTVTVSSASYTKTLSTNTYYYWQVRANNASGSSAYTVGSTFHVLADPSGLTASVNGTSAILKWNAVSGANSYIVSYKLSSASSWKTQTITTNSLEKTLAAETYNWKVQAVYTATNVTGKSMETTGADFTVPSVPTTPTNLNATVTGTSAVLSWTPVGGATSYTLQYRPATTSSWTTVTVSATSYIATLSANTQYYWQVRANNVSGSSAYATGTNFYVLAAPSSLNASVSGTSATLKWNAVTGANSYIVSYKLSSASSWTTQTVSTNSLVKSLSSGTYNWKVQAVYTATNVTSRSAETIGTNFTIISYCASQSFNTSMERINKVVFGSINNTSTGTSGYENFTSISTNVIKKSSYTITITPQSSPLWILGNHQKGYAVFIDFNQDGDFSDAGETVWTQTPTTTKSVSGTIKIPANALSGTTRMRVSMKYNNINIIYNDIPRPCELSTYGQVEDYSVNIVNSARKTSVLPDSVIEDSGNGTTASGVTLYPNPVEDILHISGINSPSAEYTQVTIIDRNGRIVKVSQVKVEDVIKINVSDLSPNIYYLNILGRSFQFIKI